MDWKKKLWHNSCYCRLPHKDISYKLIKIMINTTDLVEIIINMVIKYYKLFESVIYN